jgi:omega-amidase
VRGKVSNEAMSQTSDLSIALIQAATMPETLLSGFSNDIATQADTMEGPGVAWFRALAAEVGCVLTGSFVIRDGETVYNRLLWATPDGGLQWYDKRHLFRMAREHERYGAGADRLVVELKGWRICPQVCYDLRFPVWLRNGYEREQQRFDYDLLLFVANWPSPRRHAWRTLLQARAIENLCYVAGVNRVGTDGNNLSYSGDSAVLDFLGMPLLECGAQPMEAGVTLPAAALAEHRTRFPAWMDADRFELRD